jgi:cobalt/nickel transport system permease protein
MMLGHLTVAGLAELMVSAGVVAFLQRTDPALLKVTAGGVADTGAPESAWRATRPLWAALAAMMVLSPLGILAAGAAWGEWVASDYANPAIRRQIAAVSGNQAAPASAPQGIERLSALWTAPFASYAPPYIRSKRFGYFLSAMFGVGLIILATVGVIAVTSKAGG